jgi:hypothetical protein
MAEFEISKNSLLMLRGRVVRVVDSETMATMCRMPPGDILPVYPHFYSTLSPLPLSENVPHTDLKSL